MKVLIAEDEPALAKVLVGKFVKEGFDVKNSVTGDVVLAAAKSFMPDVIALDIMLPKRNGLDLLQDIKADPELNRIPVVMISNLDSDEDIKRAISLGAADYFVKSQHMVNEIVERVKEYAVKGR